MTTKIFPKTVVLSFTTHGEILLNSPVTDPTEITFTREGLATNIPTFHLDPRIKEFYKFNAVPPGVINFVEGDDTIDVYDIEKTRHLEKLFNESGNVAKINSGIRKIINGDIIQKTTNLYKYAEDIAELVKIVTATTISEKKLDEKTMKKELHKESDSEKLEEYNDIVEYLNSQDKSQLLVNCMEKDGFMVNKTYILGKNDVSPSGGEDWTLSCLNLPFTQGDIFDDILIWKNVSLPKSEKIPLKGEARGSVTLKDVTDFLAANEVRRIIIIDLTCAPFAVNDAYYSGQITRRFRKDISGKIPYGGGEYKDIKNICYTGIGARKNGNHTRKQYLHVMKKNFKKGCSRYIKSLKCKSCKKYKEMVNKITKKVINAHLAKKTYKIAKKTEDKLVSQMGKCNICKNNKTKTCNFKNYIEFSGAEIGKCNTL